MFEGVATPPTNTLRGFSDDTARYDAGTRREQRRIERRLEKAEGGQEPRGTGPEMSGNGIVYDVSDKYRAVPYGGIGVMHKLAKKVGLVEQIDAGLHLLLMHKPYRESDHILNIVFNELCGGRVLDDIEVRRNDAAFLDMLGARTIPDPTTAGDFCRRFDEPDVWRLMGIVNEVRCGVWRKVPGSTSSVRFAVLKEKRASVVAAPGPPFMKTNKGLSSAASSAG